MKKRINFTDHQIKELLSNIERHLTGFEYSLSIQDKEMLDLLMQKNIFYYPKSGDYKDELQFTGFAEKLFNKVGIDMNGSKELEYMKLDPGYIEYIDRLKLFLLVSHEKDRELWDIRYDLVTDKESEYSCVRYRIEEHVLKLMETIQIPEYIEYD